MPGSARRWLWLALPLMAAGCTRDFAGFAFVEDGGTRFEPSTSPDAEASGPAARTAGTGGREPIASGEAGRDAAAAGAGAPPPSEAGPPPPDASTSLDDAGDEDAGAELRTFQCIADFNQMRA